MISNKQKWLLGGLVSLSAAVWTPQVLELVGGGTSAQAGVTSGPGEEEMLLIEMETTGQAPGRSGGGPRPGGPAASVPPRPTRSVPSAAEAPSGGPLPGGPSLGYAGAPQSAAGGSTAIVSEVLRTLRQSEAFSVSTELGDPVELLPDLLEEDEPEQRMPALLLFVQSHPLRGTIVGETTQMALIGSHRVHVGDVVPGTGATLTAVARGRATLTDGEMVLDLELEPLETSETLMNARSRARNSGGAGTIDSTLEPTGGDLPAPEAQAPIQMDLPGSTGDF